MLHVEGPGMSRRAFTLLWAALTALAIALAAGPAQARPSGIEVTATERLSPRLLDLEMTTPALAHPVHTRVLLPRGYRKHPHRRYPVLYLFHGGFGSYVDWTEQGAAEQITRGFPLITVMPEDGNGGWHTDWWNGGSGGPPMWETFQVRQLIPWTDDHYRTIDGRRGRAVAGLSTGGFGSMSVAARNPDRFVWAGSFSGAVDIVGNPFVPGVIAGEAVADGGGPDDVFGNRATNEDNWRAHNPVDLAGNLRGLELVLDVGNGLPGPYDEAGSPPDLIEQQVHEMNVTFDRRLTELGIAHRFRDYGPGTHSWAYWQRDLRWALPSMMRTFAHPPSTRRRFTYTSGEPHYRIYRWRVRFRRASEIELTKLRSRGRRGFELTGSGSASVRTAPLYRPRSRHPVRIADADSARSIVRADRRGRLELRVDLGAAGGRRAKVTVALAPRR